MTRPELVEDSYVDALGERRRIAPEVRAAVRGAMGLRASHDDPPSAATLVLRPGMPLPEPAELVLEDGTELGEVASLARDIPIGYHRLRARGEERLAIVGPGRCHLPAGLREWGWAIQLASLRSTASWGIGDLVDLREVATWSAANGAGFVAVSPLGAPNPGPDPEASPYYPSTRRFLSPLHLGIAELDGADALGELAERARRLNAEPRIDRGRVLACKLEALERLWAAGTADREALDAYRSERGPSLDRWASFVVLTERFGPGWQTWPAEYRDPASDAVATAASADVDRVAFHAWIQSLLDRQLARASTATRRVADMPVGVDPGGFDAWDWQEQLAMGATIGAPPDRFNAAGQDWGLPPFVPHRLREAAYQPFIETIRAQLRHAGGLRIDHVLGLFRLWWVPSGSDPKQGAYVTQPTDELLEIVAVESHRAGAVVIGEDLGTVPPGVRAELRRRRILSTRLALFERRPPERYPPQAFAAVTTHDLPTVAGAWSGADVADQRRAGVEPDRRGLALLRRRLLRAAGLNAGATLDDLVDALHRRIAASPSMLVAATLEDALRIEERPNLPGTVSTQRDNWSIALPAPLERIVEDRGVLDLVEALRR